MARFFAWLACAVTIAAGLVEITAFFMDRGSLIATAVSKVVGPPPADPRGRDSGQASSPGSLASCGKSTVIELDPECSQVADAERREACRRNPRPQMEICVQKR